MTRRTLSRFNIDEARKRANEAWQVLAILDELADELYGLTEYMGLVRDSFKVVYPRHIEAKHFIKKTILDAHIMRSKLSDLRKRYSVIVDNYEHDFGKLDCKPAPSLVNAMVSFADLLEIAPRETIVRGFFDE